MNAWIWTALAGLAALGALAAWRLGRAVERERRRRALEAQREAERARARRVLEGGAPPLASVPVPLREGETAYYRTEAALLEPEPDGGFRRRATGELVVTDRGLWFRPRGGEEAFTPMQEVERVDVPYLDVIALVSFQDTVTRDERRTYYQVPEPLVLAAHVARFAGFELILE